MDILIWLRQNGGVFISCLLLIIELRRPLSQFVLILGLLRKLPQNLESFHLIFGQWRSLRNRNMRLRIWLLHTILQVVHFATALFNNCGWQWERIVVSLQARRVNVCVISILKWIYLDRNRRRQKLWVGTWWVKMNELALIRNMDLIAIFTIRILIVIRSHLCL